jgi:hypothetical protein
MAVARRLADVRHWAGRGLVVRARIGLAGLVVLGVVLNAKPAHASRAGHEAAGRWLAAHAAPGDAVYDTRGWAAFLSGLNTYDAWHVRQALTDSRLAYVVVGEDELRADSPRAVTLRAILRYAAEPVAQFGRKSSREDVVRVYRYRRPASWEGLKP